MGKWISALAPGVAGLMIVAAAAAQSGSPTSPGDRGPAGGAGGSSTATGEAPKSGDAAKETTKGDAAKDAMKKDTMGKGNRQQVRAAQQALKEKGHDPGPVDGMMGPKTQAAIKAFQKAEGLTETGRLDAETVAKLGVEARSGAADTGTPAASPRMGGSSK